MTSGTYSENFDRIDNWGANFTSLNSNSGSGHTRFSVASPETTGGLPSQNTVFSSGGGVQRGQQKIVVYATGATDNHAAAFDLNLNFLNTTAGSLSFNWNSVNTGSGSRQATFSIRVNTGPGGTFENLPGTSITITNNSPSNGVLRINFPAGFNNNSNAKIRFYIQTVTGTANNSLSGARPRMAIDNIQATATYSGTTPNSTITTGILSQTSFAVTATSSSSDFFVPYTSTGTFTGEWKVQLSNEDGFFSPDENLNIIGAGSGTSPILARIPAATACGNGYRVRVINTAPLRFGSVSESSITVNSTPTTNTVTLDENNAQSVTLSGTGSVVTATSTSPSTFIWLYRAGTTGAYTAIANATADNYNIRGNSFPGPGTYQVVARATAIGPCGNVVGTSMPLSVTVQGITISPTSLSFGSVGVGRQSATQSFVVTAAGLTNPLRITPPAGYQVRVAGTGSFTYAPIDLAHSGGSVNSTIEVRLAPTAAQAYNGQLNLTSGSYTATLTLTGTGIQSLAILNTRPVTDIAANTATAGGDITSNGGATVSVRGFVWGTSPSPALGTATNTTSGSGTGSYTAGLTGLQQNTRYYVRAYATNTVGTAYGEEVQFTTLPAAPSLQASNIEFSDITSYSLTVSWTKGNGSGTVVKINSSQSFSETQDGQPISPPNTKYESAGEQVVYLDNNSVKEVTVTNLEADKQYWFRVYEINNTGEQLRYNKEEQASSSRTLNNPTPLPVELFGFKALAENGAVTLQWKTASELNSSHFNVLRSGNGKNFETIGTIQSSGFSSIVRSYTFHDPNSTSAMSYYALDQVDFNGTTTRSAIISVSLKQPTNLKLSLYPNPTRDALTIINPGRLPIRICRILSLTGATVLTPQLPAIAFRNFTIGVAHLQAGVYVVQLVTEDGIRQQIRFVKSSD